MGISKCQLFSKRLQAAAEWHKTVNLNKTKQYCSPLIMEMKKISFGFSKTQKKPDFLQNAVTKSETKVDFVKCLEGQSIKLVQETLKEANKPLVIPMLESTRTAACLASLQARHDVLNGIIKSENNSDDSKPPLPPIDENETLEQRAARELLASMNRNVQDAEENGKIDIIPKPDELPLDGAKESTIDDYESVPITKFGLAMLRGMGWKDEPKDKDAKKEDIMEPIVRPKGMGLGADKLLKAKPLLVPPESNETLAIKRNAFVRVLAGKSKDLYGQIEGFDDHAGRVIVKFALGGHYESLNEFLVQPVSKKEYAEYGKVINSAKYEEYKMKESIKVEPKQEEDIRAVKQERLSPQPAASSRRYSSESEDRDRRPQADRGRRRDDHNRRRSPSHSRSSSRSSEYRRKKSSKSKKSKSRNHERSRLRHSSSEDEKRHKKKTKKSKRPRSRSRGRHR